MGRVLHTRLMRLPEYGCTNMRASGSGLSVSGDLLVDGITVIPLVDGVTVIPLVDGVTVIPLVETSL